MLNNYQNNTTNGDYLDYGLTIIRQNIKFQDLELQKLQFIL